MTILNSDLMQVPTVSEVALANVQTGSAFMKATGPVTIKPNGDIMLQVNDVEAGFVEEGAKKPSATPAIDDIEVNPVKIALIVPVSEEVTTDVAELVKAVEAITLGSLPRKLDNAIAGLTTAPAAITSLGSATVKNVTDYTSFIAAVHGGKSRKQIVLNLELLAQLKGLTSQFGVPILTIDDTHINGIPYFLTEVGSGPLGFVGPFESQARTGVVEGSLSLKATTEGSYTDPASGQLVSAFENNLVLIRAEMRAAFKVFPNALSEFNKLTVSAGS